MKRGLTNKQRFAQVVLASTVFVAPVVCATDIDTAKFGPISTAAQTDDLITITPTGSVTDGAPAAVILNSPSGQVVIQADNTLAGFSAILSKLGTGDTGLLVTGESGTVTIGAKSGIQVDETGQIGLLIDAPNVTVNNSGRIYTNTGASDTVHINAVENTTFNNLLHGTIEQQGTAPAFVTDIKSQGLTLNNYGLIRILDNANLNTIELHGQFDAVINFPGGHIRNTNIDAQTSVVLITDTGGTLFENQAGGWIDANGSDIAAPNHAIKVAAPLTTFTNAGLIDSLSGSALIIDTPGSIGTITNTGTLYSHDSNTVVLQNTVTTFTNSADIFGGANPGFVITSTAGAPLTITNGFVNTGNVTHGLGTSAIDFGTGTLTKVTYYQNDGLVVGDVNLAHFDSMGGPDVFTLSGGVISGNINANAAAPNTAYNHLLQGGAFQGIFTLGALGDTVTLTGSSADQIVGGAGNDHFILKSGRFNMIDGLGGANKITVPTTFVSDGFINNVQTIHVMNPGTQFTIGALINNLDNVLMIDPGTTTLLQFPVSGDGRIENSGRFDVDGDGILNINTFSNLSGGVLSLGPTDTLLLNVPDAVNRLHNAAGGTIEFNIAATPGTTNYGKMVVTSTLENGSSVLLDTGSFIKPQFTGFIPEGSTYDVLSLSSLGSEITDNSTVMQPNSVIVSFSKSLNAPQNNLLTLTANRASYQSLSVTSASFGVAGTLDALAVGNGPTNLDLYNLLSQLDQLPTQHQLELAMESLAPPFNYGLIDGTHMSFNAIAENITDRIWDFAWPYRFMQGEAPPPSPSKNGLNTGDWHRDFGIWLAPMGAYAHQNERQAIAGYRAYGGGGILGIDWSINPCLMVGAAASYFKTTVDDKNRFPKNERIESWQATLYGSYSFDYGFYLDGLAGYASNQFEVNRVIAANSLVTASQSSFDGNVWGLSADFGWMAPCYKQIFNTPFVRFRYIQIEMHDTVETGANDLSLSVHNHDPAYFTMGLGMRFARRYLCGNQHLIPEGTVLLGYDIKNDAEQTVANFLGGGPSFITPGYLPSAGYLELGAALNMFQANENVITFKYNIELRSQYFAQTGSVQYFWTWG